MAAALETSICEVLVKKSIRACKRESAPRLLIAGGVAANSCLRAMLVDHAADCAVDVFLPHPRYCTDNAAMIAYAAFQRYCHGLGSSPDWDANPRWLLQDL
jgi:N6-L-threonylcarbamoyladenine synthase